MNYVCSDHFLPQDFISWGRFRRVKITAIPSKNLPATTITKRKHHFDDTNVNIPDNVHSCKTAFSTPSTSHGAVEFKKDIPSLVDKSPCKSGGSTSSSSNASDMRPKYALIPSCEVTVPWTTSDSSSTGSPAPKKARKKGRIILHDQRFKG